MTALLERRPTAPEPPSRRLDADATLDRTVRTVAGLLLWAGLLLVTYWWAADGGITDLGAWNDESKLTVVVNEDAPIDSLEELADNADLFDNTIVGIEPGAGLTLAMENEVIPGYGLEDMDFTTSSTPAMLAELAKSQR